MKKSVFIFLLPTAVFSTFPCLGEPDHVDQKAHIHQKMSEHRIETVDQQDLQTLPQAIRAQKIASQEAFFSQDTQNHVKEPAPLVQSEDRHSPELDRLPLISQEPTESVELDQDLPQEVEHIVSQKVKEEVERILQESIRKGQTLDQQKMIYSALKKMALGMPLAVVAYQTYQNGQVPPYVIEAIKKGGSYLWQLSGQLSSLGSQWGGDFGSLIGQSFVTPDTPWLVRHSLAPVGGALGTIAGGIGLPYSAYRAAKCGVNSLCTYVWNHL